MAKPREPCTSTCATPAANVAHPLQQNRPRVSRELATRLGSHPANLENHLSALFCLRHVIRSALSGGLIHAVQNSTRQHQDALIDVDLRTRDHMLDDAPRLGRGINLSRVLDSSAHNHFAQRMKRMGPTPYSLSVIIQHETEVMRCSVLITSAIHVT